MNPLNESIKKGLKVI